MAGWPAYSPPQSAASSELRLTAPVSAADRRQKSSSVRTSIRTGVFARPDQAGKFVDEIDVGDDMVAPS